MSKGPRPPTDPLPSPPVQPPEPTPTSDPCGTPRELRLPIASFNPEVGSPVGVILEGDDVLVIAAGERLGSPSEAESHAIRACIEAGWRYFGQVVSVSFGTVVVRVHGLR